MSYKEANDVLNYWFGGGDRSKRPRWFGGGEEAAQEIRDKFGTLVSEDLSILSRNATIWCYVNSRRHADSEKLRVPDGNWTHDPPCSNPIWDSEFFRVCVSPRIYIISCCCYFSVGKDSKRYNCCHVASSNSERATKVFIFIGQFISVYILSAPVPFLAFFKGVIVFIILEIFFPTQAWGIWNSRNQGLLNITRALHKLLGDISATSGISSNFFRFEHFSTFWATFSLLSILRNWSSFQCFHLATISCENRSQITPSPWGRWLCKMHAAKLLHFTDAREEFSQD